MTHQTTEQRIRTKLHRMQHDDTREAQRSTPEAITQELRARLNEQFPTRTPAEIEDEIERRLARGSAPTTAVVPPNPGIPSDAQAARRAGRKKQVAAGRHLRR
jgi:hypothetical protein